MTRAEDKTILVVDDEPDVRNYLKMILEDAGFQVMTAGDGEEALELVRSRPPDFISLDLIMPRMSGHRFLYEVKRDRQLSRIPILIVTAHAHDEMGRDDLKDLFENKMISGPGTYLEKPVNPQSYVRSVKRALGLETEPPSAESTDLRTRLEDSMQNATPEALRRALEALRDAQKDS